MEDIIDYLRQQRMEQPPLPTPLSHSVRPKQRRTTYESIKLRLHLGLPGSIALMTAVGCMAPLYWDNAGYMTCYCIVLLITLLRVLIALQMNLAFQHVNPSRGVDEVAKYIFYTPYNKAYSKKLFKMLVVEGKSFSDPVIINGKEDFDKSRRVELKLVVKSSNLQDFMGISQNELGK